MRRVFPVGRLDWDSEGLLLLTNDGDLAAKLMHPSSEIPKTYHVKVQGELKDTDPAFKKLKDGINLEDGYIKPDRAAIIKFTGNNTWIEIEIHSGKNRIIRRLCDAIGRPVMKLRRVAFANLTLEGLPIGAFRDLTQPELKALYRLFADLPTIPPMRSKPGVRFARGFSPADKQKRISKKIRNENEPSIQSNTPKPYNTGTVKKPSNVRTKSQENEHREKLRQRPRKPRDNEENTQQFPRMITNRTQQTNDNRPKKAFNRNETDRPKKAFNRNETDRPKKAFNRNESDKPKKAFARNETDRPKKAFNRNEPKSRKSTRPPAGARKKTH